MPLKSREVHPLKLYQQWEDFFELELEGHVERSKQGEGTDSGRTLLDRSPARREEAASCNSNTSNLSNKSQGEIFHISSTCTLSRKTNCFRRISSLSTKSSDEQHDETNVDDKCTDTEIDDLPPDNSSSDYCVCLNDAEEWENYERSQNLLHQRIEGLFRESQNTSPNTAAMHANFEFEMTALLSTARPELLVRDVLREENTPSPASSLNSYSSKAA